jgi:hypothetical protein
MNSKTSSESASRAMTIRVHLTDGSVTSFVQQDPAQAQMIWQAVDPARLFAAPRIVVAGTHSKSVFVSCEIVRIDFIQEGLACWEFPGGYADVVELTEADFRRHAHLDQPELMIKREQATPIGDLLVSFLKLHWRGSRPLFLMIEFPVKLPVENHSFMQFLLSKGSGHFRLHGGGVGVFNLSNLAGYTVYPGVAQVPADSWMAEPVLTRPQEKA